MFEDNFYGKEKVLEILQKDPNGISITEKNILKARSGYLTKDEKEKFGLLEEPIPKKKKKEE